MKLYNQLDVSVTYQNYGSSWVLVLRGLTEEIERCVMGLYNWNATDGSKLNLDGEVDYYDSEKNLAVVWTSLPRLTKFFFKLSAHSKLVEIEDNESLDAATKTKLIQKITDEGNKFAAAKIAELRHNHEAFFDFRHTRNEPENFFRVGNSRAERPDSDFKDAVLSHAFADKN